MGLFPKRVFKSITSRCSGRCKTQTRETNFYKITPMPLSCGDNVNSRATQFRIWATGIHRALGRKGFVLYYERIESGKGRSSVRIISVSC